LRTDPLKDCSKLAVKRSIDFAAPGAWLQGDPLNQATDCFCRLGLIPRIVERRH